MENTIESQLNTLLSLQAIDCELDDITKMRGALPEEVIVLENELTDLHTRSSNIQEKCVSLEQEITAHRLNIKSSGAIVKKYEEQQMDVRNNREYDAITKEIDLQKLEIQLAEKKIKNAYELIERQKLELGQCQVRIEQQQQVLANKQKTLQVLIEESEGEEKALHGRRRKVAQRVSEKLLKTYEHIRKNVCNKLAVVVVKREACGGCFNKVPPQKQADIQEKKSIIMCEYCGRIIAGVVAPLEGS